MHFRLIHAAWKMRICEHTEEIRDKQVLLDVIDIWNMNSD